MSHCDLPPGEARDAAYLRFWLLSAYAETVGIPVPSLSSTLPSSDRDPREGGYYIDADGTEHGPFGDTEILELLPEAIERASRRFDIQILLTQEPRP